MQVPNTLGAFLLVLVGSLVPITYDFGSKFDLFEAILDDRESLVVNGLSGTRVEAPVASHLQASHVTVFRNPFVVLFADWAHGQSMIDYKFNLKAEGVVFDALSLQLVCLCRLPLGSQQLTVRPGFEP